MRMIRVYLAACLCAVLFPAAVSCGRNTAGEKTLLLYARASMLYEKGNFSGVCDLLALERHFVPAMVLRGKALYFRGDLSGAEKSLRRALRASPSQAEASLFLARLLRDGGREEEARLVTEALLYGNPQDSRALRLAADLASSRDDRESAAAFLDRAAAASSETALIFIDRARLRWKGGNGRGALEDLSRAEALLPEGNPLSKSIKELRFRIAQAVYKGEDQ